MFDDWIKKEEEYEKWKEGLKEHNRRTSVFGLIVIVIVLVFSFLVKLQVDKKYPLSDNRSRDPEKAKVVETEKK